MTSKTTAVALTTPSPALVAKPKLKTSAAYKAEIADLVREERELECDWQKTNPRPDVPFDRIKEIWMAKAETYDDWMKVDPSLALKSMGGSVGAARKFANEAMKQENEELKRKLAELEGDAA